MALPSLTIPLYTGPSEVNQLRGYLNNLCNQVNSVIAALAATGQVILLNVMRYGAVGDCVLDNSYNVISGTDDSEAINTCIGALRSATVASQFNAPSYRIYFPDGHNFLVKTTLNFTGIRNFGWGIYGSGQIVGQTNGQPVCDLTNARFCAGNGVQILGASTLQPNVGLLVARDDTGAVSDVHSFINCAVTGYYTKAACYNYGSEDFTGFRFICYNRRSDANAYAMILDGENSFGITSPYKTIPANTPVSFNDVNIFHGDWRRTNSASGSCVYLRKTAGCSLVSSYSAANDAPNFIVYKGMYDQPNLTLDVHCETTGIPCAVQFDGATTPNFFNFKFLDYLSFGSAGVFKAGTGVTLVTFTGYAIEIGGFSVAPVPGIFSDAAKFALKGGSIMVADDSYFNTPSVFWGEIISNLRATYVTAQYAVASLPTGVSVGEIAYATNGRKNGEGAGLGTGVQVFWDSQSKWIAVDSGTQVQA